MVNYLVWGLSLVLLLFRPNLLLAQLGWGVMGGLQITNISSDLPSSSQLGYQGGFFGEFDAVLIGARAEAVVSSKGAEVQIDLDDPSGPVRVKSEVDLLYLDLPLMFNVSPNPSIDLYVGPLFSIKLDDKIESQVVEGDLTRPIEDINRQLNFNGLDLGLLLGIGFNLAKFDLGARYNLGIDRAGDYEVDNLVGDFANRGWLFYLGYRFSD